MLAPSSNGRGGSQARWLRPLSAAGLGAVAGALVVAAAGRRKASHTRSPAVMDGTLFVTSPAGGPTTLRVELPCR